MSMKMITYTIFYVRKENITDALNNLHKVAFTDLQLAQDTLSNLKFIGAEIVGVYNFTEREKGKIK